MDLSFLESDPKLSPPAYTDIMFPQEEAEHQRSGSVPAGSVPAGSGSLLQNNRIWIQRWRLYLGSLVRRRRGVLTPGTAERGNPLEDLVSDNPSAATITPPPTAVTPAWGAANAFVDECKAWGEGLEGRLRDAVRSEALAKREAAEAREAAAAAREEAAVAREREEAAREREEAANRGREEALSQLRAEVDESIEQRKLWLNRENALLGRIRGLESVSNS
ncbi:MAG: hypothetical protein M1840_000662 [Geoglossum simile]|nr:MAG: hypothetical protein M1840_000662 [Geoglossum simile]